MSQRVLSQSSVEHFLSHSTGKFCRGTLQSFIDLGYRKKLCFRGLCHDFPSKSFSLKVPKNAVWEAFSLSLISGIEKIMLQRVMSRISVEMFLSQSAEKCSRGTL